MYRNQYDNDITTFSPAGRIHQIEYAMESLKLSSTAEKIFEIDSHVGVAIGGLAADARVLFKFLRSEAQNHKLVFGTPVHIARLVRLLADRAQENTMYYGRRPYGVGFIVAGVDSQGPHLFQTDPSGNFSECYATTLGARSQSAKTYLEKVFDTFPESTPEQLIQYALLALRGSTHTQELTLGNLSICVVAKGADVAVLNQDLVQPHLDALDRHLEETGQNATGDDDDAMDEEEPDAAPEPTAAVETQPDVD